MGILVMLERFGREERVGVDGIGRPRGAIESVCGSHERCLVYVDI